MLGSRPPKVKFEIGYAECVREVELFLSNLVGPQSSGVDAELQRRLKDHLNKRLEDFRSVEPLDASTKGRHPDEEPTSSLSSSASVRADDALPSADVEETDSSDSSVLNRMLKYYGNDKSSPAGKEDPPEENLLLKRLRKYQKSNEEESGHSFSCQSVTSTTGCRLAEAPVAEKHSDGVHPETDAKTFQQKEFPSAETSGCPDEPPVFVDDGDQLKRKPSSSLSLQPSKKRTAVQSHGAAPNGLSTLQTNRIEESASTHLPTPADRIPLVPRQLANGDWALVLPAGLVPNQRDESHPFSAFRLVVPSSSDSDSDAPRHRLDLSPLSSTVSDMSVEDYFSMSDGDPTERMDQNVPDSTQVVWRPW